MAQASTIHFPSFSDKRNLPGNGANAGTAETSISYNSVAQMRARLTAINSGYFTSARLDQMTDNDMVYAIRLNDDAAGF